MCCRLFICWSDNVDLEIFWLFVNDSGISHSFDFGHLMPYVINLFLCSITQQLCSIITLHPALHNCVTDINE